MRRSCFIGLVQAALTTAAPAFADEKVDINLRYQVLDACFGTRLMAASDDNTISAEYDALILKLYKSADLFERVSCIEDRQLEALAAGGKSVTLTAHKPAKPVTELKDWDRVRALDACMSTDYAGANSRGEKDKAKTEYQKMKKFVILTPDLGAFISCMDDRDDETFGQEIDKLVDDIAGDGDK